MPSSSIVVMPERIAASSILCPSVWSPTNARISFDSSSISKTPRRPRYPMPPQRSQTARHIDRFARRKPQRRQPRIVDEIGRLEDFRRLAVFAKLADQPLRDHNRATPTAADSSRRPDRAGAEWRRRPSRCAAWSSTRWPVKAACTTTWAVSVSRTSPTMMTSGSWRTKERNAARESETDARLTCDWLMPAISYSTGSSMVRIFPHRFVQDREDCRSVVVFSAASRPRDDDHAMRQLQQPAQHRFIGREKSELVDDKQAAIFRQQTNDGGLAISGSA